MSKLKEVIDFYSIPINFTYNKNRTFKTPCGGFTSLLVFGVLFLYIGYLMINMTARNLPQILNINYINDIPSPVYIKKDLTFDDPSLTREIIPIKDQSTISYWHTSIGIRDKVSNTLKKIDPTYLNLNIDQANFINGTLITTPLKYNLCTKFGDFPSAQFNVLKLNATYCINDKIDLLGIRGNEGSAWLQIRISMCNGNTTCKNSTAIAQLIPNTQLEIYYEQRQVNTTGFENTLVNSQIKQIYWDIQSTLTKLSYAELGIDRIDSYDGYFPDFLGGRYNTSYIFTVKTPKMHLKELDDDKNILIIYCVPSRYSTIYQRRFKDILNQLSFVGGISSIIFMFGFLIVSYFTNFRLTENLMNNFYNVIPSKRNKKIKIAFPEFVEKNYNKLIAEYYKINFEKLRENAIDVNNIKKEENDENSNGKNKKNDRNIIKNYKQIEMGEIKNSIKEKDGNENDSFIDYQDDCIKILNEDLIEETYNVNDDEGLINDNFSSLKRYFTLKRIESMFNVKKIERDNFLTQKKIEKEDLANINFYFELFSDKKANYVYCVEKTVYDRFKFSCYDKLYFNSFEIIARFLCRCCFKTKATTQIKKDIFRESITQKDLNLLKIKKVSNLDRNFKIYDSAVQKLGFDFDLVSILKSVENFEKFKKVCLDDVQRELFDAVSKPAIKVKDLNNKIGEKVLKEKEKDLLNLNQFRHNLMMILDQDKLLVMDKNMLENMGISLDDIKKLASIVEENKVNKEIISKEKEEKVENNKNIDNEERDYVFTDEKKESESEDEKLPPNNNPDLIKEINKQFGL